jgi:parvulin-like peptidyl-prolyl isomerase
LIKRRQEEPKRKVPKWERERQRRRIVQILIVIVIISASVIVGYGYYDARVKPWHQSIVRVNDTVFDMRYFVNMLRLYGATGQDPNQDAQLVDVVVGSLQNYEIVRQGAEGFGIYANTTGMEAEMKRQFGFDAEEETPAEFDARVEEFAEGRGLSTEDIYEMWIKPAVLQRELQEYLGERDYPEGDAFEHVQIKAMLLGTEDEALEVKDRWHAEGFDQLVNSSSPSRHYPEESEEVWLPRGIESEAFDESAFGQGSENLGVLSEPVRDTEYWTKGGYWLVMVVDERETEGEDGEEGETELQIKGILLDSSIEANELKNSLAEGGDFAELAKDHSLHSASGDQEGDLGWLTSDDIESRFGEENVDAVLGLEHDVVSEPILVETSKQSGYWLIEVLDEKEDTLSDEHRSQLVSRAYSDWLSAEKESEENELEDYLDTDKVRWALEHVSV